MAGGPRRPAPIPGLRARDAADGLSSISSTGGADRRPAAARQPAPGQGDLGAAPRSDPATLRRRLCAGRRARGGGASSPISMARLALRSGAPASPALPLGADGRHVFSGPFRLDGSTRWSILARPRACRWAAPAAGRRRRNDLTLRALARRALVRAGSSEAARSLAADRSPGAADFPNPIGLAGRLSTRTRRLPDAHARSRLSASSRSARWTPLPQEGNPLAAASSASPRDGAVINRARLQQRGARRGRRASRRPPARRRGLPAGIVGANIGKNRDASDAVGRLRCRHRRLRAARRLSRRQRPRRRTRRACAEPASAAARSPCSSSGCSRRAPGGRCR